MRISVIANALVAAFVGFGGTLALIVAAANALGATQAETASWVSAISLAVAVETAWLSWRMRMPVMAACSTPGLALIAASQGITMLCVTHEIGFAKAVADRVIFMDQGQIVEQNNPHDFFSNPQSERSKDFLSKILGH